jgi:hypothetical protein
MIKYLFACQQNDMTWNEHEFRSMNDDLAISYGLRNRTLNACKLYQNKRLIATFDGLQRQSALNGAFQQRLEASGALSLETERAYFRRRAAELRECALDAPLNPDARARVALAEDFDSLARTLETDCGRRTSPSCVKRGTPKQLSPTPLWEFGD